MKTNSIFQVVSFAALFLQCAQTSSLGISKNVPTSKALLFNRYSHLPNVTLSSDRSARLFSNPFGLLGHKTCWTNGGDNFAAATGKTYVYGFNIIFS